VVTGLAFLAIGLALSLGSKKLARFQVWARGVTKLEATEPVVVGTLQGFLRWFYVIIGVSFAVAGAMVLIFGS